MKRIAAVVALSLAATLSTACSKSPPPPKSTPNADETSRHVFEAVAPSVVAILNDDRAEREEEVKKLLKEFGDESRAPKKVIDVSLRKEPTPHGTGFVVEGGNIVTAAHVVLRPDKLKVTTKLGQTVDAELVRIDEFRDIAVLKPKEPLKDVPPVAIEEGTIREGETVWAMGHTGQGLWALSWGISKGIASGEVDLLGVKLLLFDAPVYPGFSGGPVIHRGADGKPRVIGVNHAILFTGGMMPVASVSSAVSISELRETVAGHVHPMEAKLAEYAKQQAQRTYADLFITQALSVHRDALGRQVAEIYGNARSIDSQGADTFVPVVAMLFRLPHGQQEVEFELRDPNGQTVSTAKKIVAVGEKQRVSFASAGFHFDPKTAGRYEVVSKVDGKNIGSATVAISLPNSDDELVDMHDADVSEDGDPDVDIVVASFGLDNPLTLSGVTSEWAEKSYPRRVPFTWFARGTRGWAGTNIAVTAFVLDDTGHVVGHSMGCFMPELRPERPWSCIGTGAQPIVEKEGLYDVVFAINDRPVAMWPMEAAIRTEQAPGSDIERWLNDLKRRGVKRPPPPTEAPPPPPTAKSDEKKGGPSATGAAKKKK